jgi:hypothetical protein
VLPKYGIEATEKGTSIMAACAWQLDMVQRNWLVVTGTWLLWLSIQLGIIIIPIDFHIFQRDRSTTNQVKISYPRMLI